MSSRIGIVFMFIVVIALVVRVAYVLAQDAFRLFDVSFVADDALFYLEIARNIAAGQGMSVESRPTAYVGPGYPMFLAVLFRIGLDPLGVGLLQAALGALTAGLASLTAFELARVERLKEPWETASAATAGLGTALYPHLIFWTGYVLTETLFVFLVAASLYALVRGARLQKPRWMFLAGLVSGLAAVTRSPYLAVSLLVVLWAFVAARRGRLAAVGPLLFLIGVTLPVGIWTARNVAVMGAPIVTSSEAGTVFYQGNSKGATGGTRGYVDRHDYRPLHLSADLGEVEKDAAYLRQALLDIAEDPLATIRRWPMKIVNMWRPTYEGASLRNWLVTLASYPLALVFGSIGLVALTRQGLLRPTALLLVIVLGWFAIHVLVTGMIRFRLPAEMVLLIAVPFGARMLLARLGGRMA